LVTWLDFWPNISSKDLVIRWLWNKRTKKGQHKQVEKENKYSGLAFNCFKQRYSFRYCKLDFPLLLVGKLHNTKIVLIEQQPEIKGSAL